MRALRILLCAGAAALPLASAALYVNTEGSGQVLVYPYYTVQAAEGNEFNTYVSIVNGSAQAKALRVRFREGRNGREVASFNLLLGARDMWTGAVIPLNPDILGPAGARLLSVDASCTAPALSGSLQPQVPPFLDFSAASYTGANADGLGTELDRTREGYVEVFEMAAFDVAPTCANFQASNIPNDTRRVPSGQLSGTLTLINVQSGLDFTVNPVALDEVASQPYFRPPNDPYPDYTSNEVSRNASFYLGNRYYRTNWNTPLEAVNVALLSLRLENELVMDGGTRSGTDFVVTMPTKRLANAGAPFASASTVEIPVHLIFTTREGAALNVSGSCGGFICSPTNQSGDVRLRWASSVMSFRTTTQASSGAAGTSDVLGSRNGWLVNLQTPGGAQNGYLSMTLERTGMETEFPLLHSYTLLQSGAATDVRPTYAGLPAVGFMVRTFRNGNLACTGATVCQGNYGGAFPHRWQRFANQ